MSDTIRRRRDEEAHEASGAVVEGCDDDERDAESQRVSHEERCALDLALGRGRQGQDPPRMAPMQGVQPMAKIEPSVNAAPRPERPPTSFVPIRR